MTTFVAQLRSPSLQPFGSDINLIYLIEILFDLYGNLPGEVAKRKLDLDKIKFKSLTASYPSPRTTCSKYSVEINFSCHVAMGQIGLERKSMAVFILTFYTL